MQRVDEGKRCRTRVVAQVVREAKGDHRASGRSNTDVRECTGKRLHPCHKALVLFVNLNMYKPLRVSRIDDLGEIHDALAHMRKVRIRRDREHHFVLRRVFDDAEDAVFLQHVVIVNRVGAAVKDVDVTDGHLVKEEVTKGFGIRPVAEAARNDGDQLAPGASSLMAIAKKPAYRLPVSTPIDRSSRRWSEPLWIFL